MRGGRERVMRRRASNPRPKSPFAVMPRVASRQRKWEWGKRGKMGPGAKRDSSSRQGGAQRRGAGKKGPLGAGKKGPLGAGAGQVFKRRRAFDSGPNSPLRRSGGARGGWQAWQGPTGKGGGGQGLGSGASVPLDHGATPHGARAHVQQRSPQGTGGSSYKGLGSEPHKRMCL